MELFESNPSSSFLSPEENAVLSIFRKCLMTPGEMLCFSDADLEDFKRPLGDLANRGYLIIEESPGGYSLTETGFTAMKEGA